MSVATKIGARERLSAVGRSALSDEELVSLLLGTGSRASPVEALAGRVLRATGGLRGLERAGLGELVALEGMGHGKASRLLAAVELGRRVLAQPLQRGTRIRSSREVDAALRPRLAWAEREEFLAIPLDAKHRPCGEISVSVGGLSACPVDPRDVFRALLREAAAAVIFVHNHPSGEPSPSPEDAALTERLRQAGELLGVRVLDHVIIAHEGYFSFLDAGLLSGHEGRHAPRR